MPTIHCSTLPRLLACPGSRIPPVNAIASTSPEADTGTAVHAVMARIVAGNLDAVPDDVTDDDVRRLAWSGLKIWRQLRDSLANVEAEKHMIGADSTLPLEGTADVIGCTPVNDIAILDWKSGRVERDYLSQIKGYLYLSGAKQGGKAIICWLQSGEFEVRDISADDMAKFHLDYIEAMAHSARTAAGEHCAFCRRQHECPAFAAMQRSSLALLAPESLPTLTPVQVADLYPRLQAVERACDDFRKLARQIVQDAGGSITLTDGRVLGMDTPKPMDELIGTLGAFAAVLPATATVKIGKTILLDSIGAATAKGKGKAKETAMQAMEAAGLVSKKQGEPRLSIKTAKKEIEKV